MQTALDTLRDRSAKTAAFRDAAGKVCIQLMQEAKTHLQRSGVEPNDVIMVVILRAAIAFLDAAVHTFPDAPVGVLGMRRDEGTFAPHWYYENLPPLSKQSAIIVLDPMLATGGSAEAAALRLTERGAEARNIYFVGIIAAPEGVARLARLIPRENIMLAAIDAKLDASGMIVPGFGDFGDRYFGHAGHAVLGPQ